MWAIYFDKNKKILNLFKSYKMIDYKNFSLMYKNEQSG